MTITINGKERALDNSTLTIGELLESLRLDPGRVVVERNREILPRACFGETTVRDGDVLEIVQFVGGG